MEMWTKVRRSVLTGKLSKRQACKQYEIHWETLEKILANPEPPAQRRQGERGEAGDRPLSVDHSRDFGVGQGGTEKAAAYGEEDF